MNVNSALSSLIGNGGANMNPEDIMKILGLNNISMDKVKAEIVNMMFSKLIADLYAEYPTEDRKELFYEDPRRSEKEKSITALFSKGLPSYLKKLNNNDLDVLFDKIQKHKGGL